MVLCDYAPMLQALKYSGLSFSRLRFSRLRFKRSQVTGLKPFLKSRRRPASGSSPW